MTDRDRLDELGRHLASLPALRPDIAAWGHALADTLKRAAQADTVAALGAYMVVAEALAAELAQARASVTPQAPRPCHMDGQTRDTVAALVAQVGQLTFATLHRESCGPALFTAYEAVKKRLGVI